MIFEEDESGKGYLLSRYRFDTEEERNLVIPEQYNGQPVIGLSSWNLSEVLMGIKSIHIPKTVIKGLRNLRGSGGANIEQITVDAETPAYHMSGNCLIDTESKTLICGFGNSVIPTDGSVTSIAYGAFVFCENLISIIIPDSVITIGSHTFYGCSNLSTIYCMAESKPEGWDNSWLEDCEAEVVWGYNPSDDQ